MLYISKLCHFAIARLLDFLQLPSLFLPTHSVFTWARPLHSLVIQANLVANRKEQIRSIRETLTV